jgi:S-methylmethionine-dependent homocysteine/selenocysteine methylase
MKGVSEAVKKNGGVLILDGGMITGMEDLGANLYGAYNLWYPQFMDDEPDLIEKTHQKYYSSGADIVMSATYN